MAAQSTFDSSDPGPPELIGQVLGGAYRVVGELDAGGMGRVYEAEHVRLKRRLAVKVMAGHLTQDQNALARFHREAEIISQLEHPHIVQVTDFDTTPAGQPFLVMEYLRGWSLESRLQSDQHMSIAEALRVATQAASGLSAAHAVDVVHRDLKPANVFLVDGGASGWPEQVFVKLLDFGISKRAGHSRGLTGEFDILGTPDYMAPEQALGKTAAVDHRGDQFALAVITYEMLTGALPFAADEVMDVLQRVIRDTPSAPSALRADLPLALNDVLLRALSKRPEDRYATIAEFAEALNVAGGEHGRPSTPVPSAPSGRPPRFSEALTLTSPPAPKVTTNPEAASQPPTPTKSSPPRGRPTSWTRKDPVQTVRELIERTRQELGLGNAEMAHRYAESALSIADELHARQDVTTLTTSAVTLFERVFETYVGRMSGVLVIDEVPSGHSNLSPQQAFLLSRIDGHLSIEEAIDLSPLPRVQTLRHLADLLRAGLLKIDRTSTDRTRSRRRGT